MSKRNQPGKVIDERNKSSSLQEFLFDKENDHLFTFEASLQRAKELHDKIKNGEKLKFERY